MQWRLMLRLKFMQKRKERHHHTFKWSFYPSRYKRKEFVCWNGVLKGDTLLLLPNLKLQHFPILLTMKVSPSLILLRQQIKCKMHYNLLLFNLQTLSFCMICMYLWTLFLLIDGGFICYAILCLRLVLNRIKMHALT